MRFVYGHATHPKRKPEEFPVTKAAQIELELAVFRRFAEVCPHAIDPGSIASSESKTDIECYIDGQRVYFELTEAVPSDQAKGDQDSESLQLYLEEVLADLGPEARKRFEEKYNGCRISAVFEDGMPMNALKCDLVTIVSMLDSFDTFTSDITTIEEGIGIYDWVHLFWGISDEFTFVIENGGGYTDPISPAIRAKLNKTYPGLDPIELLVYTNRVPMGYPETVQSMMLPMLKSELSLSAFRRCWIFDNNEEEVVLVHPEP